MKLLVDENVHADIVRWFRSLGHDVLYICESSPGDQDNELLALAREQNRVLITDDLDFGDLIFRQRLNSTGVVLIRLHDAAIERRIDRLAKVWPFVQSHLPGRFIVISDKRVRVRPLPV
jgi:predicted nuclease of predicted toxin-antitoxin system